MPDLTSDSDLAERVAELYYAGVVLGVKNPGRWKEWLDAVHDGGKKKVPNPDSANARRFPQVSFSTALRNDQFRAKAVEEFNKWKEDNPTARPRKKRKAPGEETSPAAPPPPPPPPKPRTPLEANKKVTVGNTEIRCEITSRGLGDVNRMFRDKTPSMEDIHEMFGVDDPNLKGKIIIDYDEDVGMDVYADYEDSNGVTRAYVHRKFTRPGTKLKVQHEMMRMDSSIKGAGHGSKILKNSFEMYEKMGVSEVEQTCAWDGRYVWARMGYKMDDYSLKKTKDKLKSVLFNKLTDGSNKQIKAVADWVEDSVKSGQDIADLYLPDGTHFGKEFLLDHVGMYDATLSIDQKDPNYQRIKKYLAGDKTVEKKRVDFSLEDDLYDDNPENFGDEYDPGINQQESPRK